MKKIQMQTLLTHTDEDTEQQIAKLFPYRKDMEHVFQRSLDKLEGESTPHTVKQQTKRYFAVRYITAAACLFLTVGLGVGVWSRQQRIEPLPPQKTQTTTVMQTETKTETTTQVTTGSQTTHKQTQTTRNATETSIDQPEVIVSSTALTTVMTVAMTPERTGTVATVQTTITVTAAPTVPVMTTVTTMPTYEGNYGTVAPRETTPSPIESTRTEMITKTTPSPIESTQTETITEPSNPSAISSLEDFQISEPDSDDMVQIAYQKPINPSPADFIVYALHLEHFHAAEGDQPTTPEKSSVKKECTYIIVSDAGEIYYLSQYERDSFVFRCYESDELINAEVCGHPAVLQKNEQFCILRWDDGSYTFALMGNPDEAETLIDIAEHIKPSETISEQEVIL